MKGWQYRGDSGIGVRRSPGFAVDRSTPMTRREHT
jgi:hypothetical protein